MSAAVAADPVQAIPRRASPALRRVVNKRDLCREAGIARNTLDDCIARDPHFPILRRGGGNGDSWEFDAEAALARLRDAVARPKEDLSPGQQLTALKVRGMERKLAEEAGALLRADEAAGALARTAVALRRGLATSIPAKAREQLGLSAEQARALRLLIEQELRSFVEGLRETGLPDAER